MASDTINIKHRTQEIDWSASQPFDFEHAVENGNPVVLRGYAAGLKPVQEAIKSPNAVISYLRTFYNGRPMVRYTGQLADKGRFFYNTGMDGMNFTADTVTLDAFWDDLTGAAMTKDQPSYYIGSTDLAGFFPGLDEDLRLEPLATDEDNQMRFASLWMGNRTTAATHYDMSHNAAYCIAGRRRFTLFPPDQIQNLYPGPLEPTPGGQVVSMVDLRAPDSDRFPRFKTALESAQVADLAPGDVLVYPALWWHNVDALDPFNILINVWWNTAPPFLDSPMVTLLHGLLSLRGRSMQEKHAWAELFQYYLFGDGETAIDHLPDHTHGALAPLRAGEARRLRAMILRKLNR